MKASHVLSALTFSVVAFAGVVSAQTTNFVNVSTSGGTTSPSAGQSGATLGTITLTAAQAEEFGNVSLSSIPVTLTTGNGATASNLTGCQLFGPTGTALTSGSNSVGTAGATNTFTFDTPLQIAGGQSTTLSIRCNVASGAASGGTYQFSAGMPTFGTGLHVNLNASPNVRPGAQDTLLALISLSGIRSGSATQIQSLPLTVSFNNGAQVGHLTDCRVRNLSNLTNPLNNGGNAVGITQGTNTIPLDNPLQIAAGSSQTLAFTCDVSAAAPVGGQVTMSLTPSSLAATVVGSGSIVTPTAGFTANGQVGATSGTVTFSNTATPTTPTTPTVPGVPNTGNNSIPALILLTLSGIVALGGLLMARRLAMSN